MKLNEVTIVESKFNEAQQLDELNWSDIKKGAGKVGSSAKWLGNKIAAAPGAIQRGAKAVEKGANAYTKGVKKTGNAVAGAANALGLAGAETFKQAVARPVTGVWDAGKSVAQGATSAVQKGYGDVKQGVQTVGKGISTAQTDIGNVGKFAGNVGAKALGGAAKTVGAVASVPQGLGRATKRGYSAGVNAISGPDDKTLAAQNKSNAQTSPKTTQNPFSMPSGYSSMTYSMPGVKSAGASTTRPVDAAFAAIDSLDKNGKKAIYNKLETELYSNRSDSGRRALARGDKIKKATMPNVAMAESREYKTWGKK